MGIFDWIQNKLGGLNNSKSNDIFLFFQMCSVLISSADEEISEVEVNHWMDCLKSKYLDSFSNYNEFSSQIDKNQEIIASLNDTQIRSKLSEMSNFETELKDELINLLFDIMIADNNIHVKELNVLYAIGQCIKYDLDKIRLKIVEKIGFHPEMKNNNLSIDLNDKKVKAFAESYKSMSKRFDLFKEIELLINDKEYDSCKEKCTELINMLEKTSKDLDNSIIQQATPDFSISFNVLDIYHKRGVCLFSQNNPDSIKDFSYVIKRNKNYPDAYYMRGLAYLVNLEDWQSSIPDIQKYLSFEPEDDSANKLLQVLNQIKTNSDKINKLYKKLVKEYNKAEKLLQNDKEEKGVEVINNCLKIIEGIDKLYTQKNRAYIYQKSHGFSLCDILFKKLQCLLQKGGYEVSNETAEVDESNNNILQLCMQIALASKGRFKPKKSELGSKIYYQLFDNLNKK